MSGSKPNSGRWGEVPELRSRIMRANRRRDTRPERAVRSALHSEGFRFRVDFSIRPSVGRPIRPDVVFTRRRVVLFIDGCYWHGCPRHGTLPATNREYWTAKIAENRARDTRHTDLLEQDGWTVVRAWEHEDAAQVVGRVKQALKTTAHAR